MARTIKLTLKVEPDADNGTRYARLYLKTRAAEAVYALFHATDFSKIRYADGTRVPNTLRGFINYHFECIWKEIQKKDRVGNRGSAGTNGTNVNKS